MDRNIERMCDTFLWTRHRTSLPLLVLTYGLTSIPPLPAQDLKSEIRRIDSPTFDGADMDAPDGVSIFDAPSKEANVLQTLPGPLVLKATNYLESGGERFYLTEEARQLLWDEKPTYWVSIPGTRRAAFIEGTTPATLVKREVRDFFKTGPETAEVYEETVNVEPITSWGPEFRRAETDFRLSAKVASFKNGETGSWEAVFTIFPAFDSNTDRIPGPAPEIYGEPHRVLITRPVQREVTLRGVGKVEIMQSLLIPGTVWAAAFSEGRIAGLRLGWHDIQSPQEVSRLSPPQFTRGERMRFRFQTNRLLDSSARIEIEPDRIVGVDYTAYDPIALLGGAPGPDSDEGFEKHLQSLWNITVGPDLIIDVVAPLLDGRGAAGMLELESLGLGPSFEEELKAVAALAETEAPPLPDPEDSRWLQIRTHKLGSVPESQRGPETQF